MDVTLQEYRWMINHSQDFYKHINDGWIALARDGAWVCMIRK